VKVRLAALGALAESAPTAPLAFASLALFLLAFTGGCSPRSHRPLRVEYAGCEQVVFPGPVCALTSGPDARLRLWVDLPGEVPLAIEVDRQPLASRALTSIEEDDGQGFALQLPPGAKAVTLRAATTTGETMWSLRLAPIRQDAASELRQQAHRANADDHQDQARSLLLRAAAVHHAAGFLAAEASDRVAAASMDIATNHLSAARRELDDLRLGPGFPVESFFFQRFDAALLEERVGDARSALDDITAAATLARRLGLAKLQVDADQILARQLQALGRSRESVDLFDRLRRRLPAGTKPCDLAVVLINQGWSLLLAGERGQRLGDPIPLFEQALAIEQQDGMPCLMRQERIVTLLLNLALAHLQAGTPGAMPDLLARATTLDADATTVDRLWHLDLEARLALAQGRPAAARSLYSQLDAAATRALAPDSRWRAAYGEALCDRALGHRDHALAALDRADLLLAGESLKVPIHEGREMFLAGREQATELHLELLLDVGRDAEAFTVARRARSRLLRQLARGDRLAHLTPAQKERWYQELDEYSRQRRPLDDGAAADWKLPEDERRRAVARRAAQEVAARRSLDRAFGVLDAAGDRDAPLPGARPGELTLAFHPVGGRWVEFAQSSPSAVVARRFDLPDASLGNPRDLARRLLAPVAPLIAGARRVRILPYGALRGVDFHALPFGSDVLLAGRPVVYGLDLASPETVSEGIPAETPGQAATTPPAATSRALIVADPLGDLPEAAREGDAVASALRRNTAPKPPRWTLDLLQGAGATAANVKRSLARADLFHYAGHGIFAGARGWDSDLLLAGGSRLTVGDLLALPGAPRWVVLAGCDTGKSSAEAPIEGLGIAAAFLLAGSHAVIATTGAIDDGAARRLVADLYDRWDRREPWNPWNRSDADLATLLQQAQLAWRRANPGGAWASFRIFEP
jgi:hypothetical protein